MATANLVPGSCSAAKSDTAARERRIPSVRRMERAYYDDGVRASRPHAPAVSAGAVADTPRPGETPSRCGRDARTPSQAYYDERPEMTALSIEDLAATSDDAAVRRRF